jgi:predicted ribonuclease YlaK
MATTQKKRPVSGGYLATSKKTSSNAINRLKLDKYQIEFVSALLDEEKRIVFCNAPSGSGKTTLAVGAGIMLIEEGKYGEMLYVIEPVQERVQGFLPGSLLDRSKPYFEGLYQALTECGENLNLCMTDNERESEGAGFVTAMTSTFLRGRNFDNKYVLLDETQNMGEDSLRKTITRAKENSKVIIIGHSDQIDLRNKSQSAFEKCIRHFASKNDPRVAVCNLVENYRGWVSKTADEPWVE